MVKFNICDDSYFVQILFWSNCYEMCPKR